MSCPVTIAGRPCGWPSLREDPTGACFNHSPRATRKRREARAAGGRAKALGQRAQLEVQAMPSSGPAPVAIELGALESVAQIRDATLVVARALARNEITPQKARALAELLRDAQARAEAVGDDGPGDVGGRELTADEEAYVLANEGALPPGLRLVRLATMLVDGPEWRPPVADAPEEPPVDAGPPEDLPEPVEGDLESPPSTAPMPPLSNVVPLRAPEEDL